jgi:hypothetical protein
MASTSRASNASAGASDALRSPAIGSVATTPRDRSLDEFGSRRKSAWLPTRTIPAGRSVALVGRPRSRLIKDESRLS